MAKPRTDRNLGARGVRLGIAWKIVIALSLFVLPLGVLFFLYMGSLNDSIEFARKERLGVAALQPLHVMALELPRGAQADAARLARARQDVAAVYQSAGGDLSLTEARLAERQLPDVLPARFLAAYDKAAQSKDAADAAAVAKTVRDSIGFVGDTSNLILDPDLDSYYLMDAVLLALPQSLYRVQALAESAGRGLDALPAGIAASMLQEADLDRIAADVKTVFAEDAHFYGVSPTLKPGLEAPAAALAASGAALVEALRSHAQTGGDLAPAIERYRADLDALWTAGLGELDALLSIRTAEYRQRLLQGSLVTFAVLAFAMLVVTFILRRMIRQIQVNAEFIEHLAGNDLSGGIKLNSRDELGTMARELEQLAQHWAANIAALAESSSQLLDGSGELERTGGALVGMSDQLSTGVSAISAAIEELDSSLASVQSTIGLHMEVVNRAMGDVEQVRQSGRQTEATVASIAESLAESRAISAEGQLGIERSFAAVEAVTGELMDTAGQVRALETGINAIQDIVGSIADISQQTRLLAMNASIEAAHAGTAGKGFAVVAGAVQGLAMAVDAKTAEIGKQLKTLQESTALAVAKVGAMENGSRSLSESVASGHQALRSILACIDGLGSRLDQLGEASRQQERAMAAMSESFDRLHQLAVQIQAAVDEQAEGAQEITRSTQGIRSSSDAGTASTQAVLNQSRLLTSQGKSLRSLIDAYRLPAKN